MALVSAAGTGVQVPAICDTRSVRTELERRLHSDQASRTGNAPDVDKENAVRLAGIVDNCGWPPVSEFGREASLGAFLVLQHADLDLQMELVPLLRAADRAGELPPGTLPLLEDRIRVRQGMPHIYGTQIRGAGTPYLIENPEGLEERRRNAGLEPFEDYLKRFPHP
ncbi:hypothetical protein CSC62_03875 [Pseudoxanthomonas jiangsuensis]|uniref:DUF6624 domain-containing protein n=1 Tax=Pseudoxanthomonas jiangsuensis TaxID=619688 RepID=UPI001390F7FB|nr:DUF6624 domain-containing protein [Pseudoxanthomonas jiangsuensis]KAF1698697.1 hypothetical protein CSC62_03875 [Pseudoxanthomonas jiangsuensis]